MHHCKKTMTNKKTGKVTVTQFFLMLSLFVLTLNHAHGQCVGETTSVSIPRNIGCGSGTGGDAQWDGVSGGSISDPGGSSSTFNVTWTNASTFRLKRIFPGACGTIYSQYFTVTVTPTQYTVSGGGSFCSGGSGVSVTLNGSQT